MIDHLDLYEYESKTLAITEGLARLVKVEGRKYLDITPDQAPGRWAITAREYVGTLVVDDLRILVRPKIKPENLFLLLEVGLPRSAWREEDFDYAVDHDLLRFLVSFFARTVETTLARGLYRSYRTRRQDLKTIRGRIDFGRQLSRARLPLPVACRYGEFTADVVENRILRAALRMSLRIPRVPVDDRRRMMRELVAMEEVSDSPATGEDVQRVHYTRLNEHYRPALGLARLLLDNLTLVDRRGATSAASFMVNMNDLFERFVTERLRRATQGRLILESQVTDHLDTAKQVQIRPDLLFRHPDSGRVTYVGDIKYKLADDAWGRSPDYYQLLAYTTALDLPEGVLIYCRTEGAARAKEVTVRNAGKTLHVRSVDMGGSSSEVRAEIRRLADWIVGRSHLVRAGPVGSPARPSAYRLARSGPGV